MAYTTQKPIIVLIPGAWHTTDSFLPLITQLSLATYPTIAISLPSASVHPGLQSLTPDIDYVRNVIKSLVDAEKEVVVVMHSGGGLSGSEAVQGLSVQSQKDKSKLGGVVKLVYVGILLPSAGSTMAETFQKAVTAEDLDPDFVIDQDQSFHVIAEVGENDVDSVETYANACVIC